MKKCPALLWFGLVGALTARAYVLDFNATGQCRAWSLAVPDPLVLTNIVNPQTHAIRYFIASDGYSTTNRVAELNAVRASFAQWQAISGTSLKFEDAGLVAPGVDINTEDHTNVVFWAKNSTLVNGGLDDLTGALGYSFFSFYDNNVMAESDIVLNGVSFVWTTDPNATDKVYFVEAVMLHEIGHLVGLAHSPLGSTTMFARGDAGVSAQAGLSTDEMASARTLYPLPGFAASMAKLQGQVTLDGRPVLGAVVVVEDNAGNVTAGTVTRADGSYQMASMPPGNYQARVTPLDPPTGSPLIVGGDIGFDYQGAETGFIPTDANSMTLIAGGVQTLNFSVMSGNPAFRITRMRPPGSNPNLFVIVNAPASILPGQSNLVIGVYGPDLPVSGATLTVFGDGVTMGPTIFDPAIFTSVKCISARISVALNATPGMRTLAVQSGTNIAYANGFLSIHSLTPDNNFDGLDDNFQRRYFPLWTVPAAGPAADPDGDGMNNLAEYMAGTDPTNPASIFKINRVVPSSTGMKITWDSAAGKTYQVMARAQFTSGSWQAIGTITATGSSTQFLDPSGLGAMRAYRLQVQR